jgi:hypothetical protein
MVDDEIGVDGSEPSNASGSAGAAGNESGSVGGIPIAAPETAKRGRGRPAGTGNSNSSAGKSTKPRSSTKQTKAAPVSVTGIEKILFSLHMGLAKFSGVDELEIDNEEAKLLAAAVAEVSSHYNVVIDPKTVAWVGLAGVLGAVYAPRIASFKMRKMMEKKAKEPVEMQRAANNAAPVATAPFQDFHVNIPQQ